MSHQLTNHMMKEAAYFVVWTQLWLCRRNNVYSLPRNPSWLSAGNVSLQSVSSIGPHSCTTARRRTQEWWRQQGEKRTGNWVVRGKRRGKNNERKVNGKEGFVMKASAGKLLKKNQGNHHCTTALSVPSLFCSEAVVSILCITSDWPETQPQEKQYSCLGQQPGCCLPKNIFIQLEVTILCFWKCNIWYKPRVLTYPFWKWRSDLGFSSSFWLKSF